MSKHNKRGGASAPTATVTPAREWVKADGNARTCDVNPELGIITVGNVKTTPYLDDKKTPGVTMRNTFVFRHTAIPRNGASDLVWADLMELTRQASKSLVIDAQKLRRPSGQAAFNAKRIEYNINALATKPRSTMTVEEKIERLFDQMNPEQQKKFLTKAA